MSAVTVWWISGRTARCTCTSSTFRVYAGSIEWLLGRGTHSTAASYNCRCTGSLAGAPVTWVLEGGTGRGGLISANSAVSVPTATPPLPPFRPDKRARVLRATVHRMAARLAIVYAICNGTDWARSPPIKQIERVGAALDCFGANRSNVRVLSTGFQRYDTVGGIHLDDVPPLAFQPRYKDDGAHLWVNEGRVQLRRDGACTLTKFHAWNLTNLDAVAVLDSDICLHNPASVWNALANFSQSSQPFAAGPERAKRKYRGFNTRVMFLKPSPAIFKVLIDKAASGDFLPYSNTEQDVIETVFSPSVHAKKNLAPHHEHQKGCTCKVSTGR